jgi:hypothetical protein
VLISCSGPNDAGWHAFFCFAKCKHYHFYHSYSIRLYMYRPQKTYLIFGFNGWSRNPNTGFVDQTQKLTKNKNPKEIFSNQEQIFFSPHLLVFNLLTITVENIRKCWYLKIKKMIMLTCNIIKLKTYCSIIHLLYFFISISIMGIRNAHAYTYSVRQLTLQNVHDICLAQIPHDNENKRIRQRPSIDIDCSLLVRTRGNNNIKSNTQYLLTISIMEGWF